jgi:hypothetical protein
MLGDRRLPQGEPSGDIAGSELPGGCEIFDDPAARRVGDAVKLSMLNMGLIASSRRNH